MRVNLVGIRTLTFLAARLRHATPRERGVSFKLTSLSLSLLRLSFLLRVLPFLSLLELELEDLLDEEGWLLPPRLHERAGHAPVGDDADPPTSCKIGTLRLNVVFVSMPCPPWA